MYKNVSNDICKSRPKQISQIWTTLLPRMNLAIFRGNQRGNLTKMMFSVVLDRFRGFEKDVYVS